MRNQIFYHRHQCYILSDFIYLLLLIIWMIKILGTYCVNERSQVLKYRNDKKLVILPHNIHNININKFKKNSTQNILNLYNRAP